MKNSNFALPQIRLTILSASFCLFTLLIPSLGFTQSFQRFYGNTLDDSFSKVIKDGSNYYVLGQTEPSAGAIAHATVTRLDAQGLHLWTLTLGIPSIWNDAVIIPGGDLLVVGSTLPFDPSSESLMGRVTSMGNGNFTWLRSYDAPGRDYFNRIVNNPAPENGLFPYYVLGSQNEPGGTPTTEDVVLFNLDATGNFNWKKIYNITGDDEFFRDLDVLPNGDLLLAGNGANGLIYKTDNTGSVFGGVQIPFISFNDIGLESAGGLYATADNDSNSDAHILKFDQDLILLWDVIIPQLASISQVWEGISGEIYATGRGSFGGQDRDVIIKLLDSGPSIVWVKYLDAGNGFVGGSSWLMPNNEIAYSDARVIPGGLGGDCAFISVSDLDLLTACMVSEDMATLIFSDPIPDGPIPPPINFQDFPMGTDLFPLTIDWLEGEVCNNDPCGVTITLTDLDSCGMIQATANATGPGPYTYQWCDGQTSADYTTILPCGVHEFCVSVTCGDGTVSSASVLINISDNIPPQAVCIPPEGVILDSNCMFIVTPAFIDGGSSDNCLIQSMTVSPMVLTGCGIFPITLTVTDWCGNVSTCMTEIQTIEDVPPVLTGCPQDLTVTGVLDTNGVCIADVQLVTPIASDLCSSPVLLTNSFNNTTNASGTYPLGMTTVVWTATDECGNESTCSFTVTVDPCEIDICCPEFSLKQLNNIMPCLGDSSCMNDGVFVEGNPSMEKMVMVACKNSLEHYYVVPKLPGFTYNWTFIGGTPTVFTGNPGVVTWGNSNSGSIQVIVADSSGTCLDTITKEICLLDSPIAGFTVAPGLTVCTNQLVNFSNTSVGANTYSWDFGDNTGSTSQNPPPHGYPSPGAYTVLLTVSNGAGGNTDIECGCKDTASVVITVVEGTGPTIIPDCKQMLCPGDTSSYCVTPGCTPYTWTVNGGTIIATKDSCVTVVWDASAPTTFPSSVSVTTGCVSICGNSATLNVPVLWNNIPISGPTIVCVGATETYSLPTMPGTFYTWIVTGGGGFITSPNKNTPSINVQWFGPIGTATIICNYENPYSECSGTDTIIVDVKTKFIITGPSPDCVGNTGVYTASNGALPVWTISGASSGYTVGPTNGVSSISVNWFLPGNYTITAKTPPGAFCNSTQVINVAVNPNPLITLNGPPIICPNQLYTYSASSNLPVGNFVWSLVGGGTVSPYGPNNSNASVSFTGTAPWTLTATQTVDGCSGSATITVNKDPVPTLPVGPITKCIGGKINVTASGNGPFIWSTSPAASLLSPQGLNPATYEIHANGTITVSNCSGTSIALSVIADTPLPISITQTGKLCDGDLQLIAPAGGTYQWYGGSSSTNGTISVFNPGTYTVQMTKDGCISVATVTILPVPIPDVTISTGDPIKWCIPATPTVNLQAFTLSTGCTYQWFDSNNLPISGATNSTYIATSQGSYYVEVDCGGCMATSNIITIIEDICLPPPMGCIGVPNPLGIINVTTVAPIALCDTKEFSVNVIGCSGTMITWIFGDGNSITANSGTTVSNTYSSPGAYLVTATIVCNGCEFTVYTNVNIPVIADFIYSIKCGLNGSDTISLENTSQLLGGWNVTSINWTSSCGNFTTSSGNTFVIDIPSGCSPTVSMNITVNNPTTLETCNDSKTFTFNLPTAPILSITGPATVCKDQASTFNSSLSGAGFSQYEWTVDGQPVSQNDSLVYSFDGVPVNPVIGLTVTDTSGCTFISMDTITVVTPRILTVDPVNICPDCQPPAMLTSTPLAGFINYQWYHNGAAISGATSSTYTLCNFDASGNYYVTAEDDQNNKCKVTSDTVQVAYHPKPLADIQGQSVQCNLNNILLENAGSPNSNYTYNWTATGPGTVTFTPNNSHATMASATQIGTYEVILMVTDNNTGCFAKDTLCIYLFQTPTVNVNVPGGTLCAGIPHTFTATASPPGNYIYQWNNGVMGPIMTTSLPGFYTVTATSPESGCSGIGFAGNIRPLPPVVLFPVGCDTICDTDSIVPPLALGGQYIPSFYTVEWYLDEDYNIAPFHTGPVLNLAGLVPSPLGYGINDISIIVTYQGCSDTSNVYNLFIEECCVCKSDFTLSHSGVEYPVFCDPHVGFIPILPCPADDVYVSGFIGLFDPITDEPCGETVVLWELIKPDSTIVGGVTSNSSTIIFFKDSVDIPGLYCLTLTIFSSDGLESCVCKVSWIKEPCEDCCISEEEFCERLDNAVSLSVDDQLCKATLNIGDFGCNSYIQWVDWDYPNLLQQGPFQQGSTPMHSYPGSGTYTICYLAIELDSLDQFCREKQICDTITLACQNCPCDPADIDEISNAVAQGFATISNSLSCVRCFAPIALSNCEQVEWHINNITPTPVFSSTGNQTFCYNFVNSGTYEVIMVVKRFKPDGSVCELFTYSRFITVNCSFDPILCNEIVFPNPEFGKGAIPGGLNPEGMGMSDGWTAASGAPIVVEGAPGSLDGWTIDVSSSMESIDVLTTIEPICPDNNIDTLSLRFGIKEKGTKSTVSIAFYRGDEFEVPDSTTWNPIRCLRLATIDLDPLEENVWYDLDIIYDISEWIELDTCSIRPAIYTSCCNGPVTSRTSVQVDGFCGKTIVSIEEIASKQTINLFPNPTTGELTIRFDDASPRNGQIQILDLLGQVVKTETLTNGSRDHKFSLETLPTGVYFIKITENGMPIWAKKVIKI